jgi:hypothetical protein
VRTPTPLKRRIRAHLLGLATATVCLGLLPSAALAANKPAKPLYWGASIGSQLTGTAAPWDPKAIDEFERLAGKKESVVAFSSPFADCDTSPCSFFPFPTPAMEILRQRGTIPFLSWASQSVPSSLHEPHFKLSAISSGALDGYIREFAEAAREWGHPFFFRFDPEMNGFWFPWSEGVNGNKPGEFVAAWRHVHDIFTEVGATNATWVWCPNVDFNRDLTSLHSLYPGGKYVDWTCLDGFNWGHTANSVGWQSFNEIFRSTYRRVLRIAPHKPMFVGETASDDRGGSKSAWIRNLLQVVPSHYRRIRGLLWYDEPDQSMHWPIESSKAATNAFAKGISRAVYRQNSYGELPAGPIAPPRW